MIKHFIMHKMLCDSSVDKILGITPPGDTKYTWSKQNLQLLTNIIVYTRYLATECAQWGLEIRERENCVPS